MNWVSRNVSWVLKEEAKSEDWCQIYLTHFVGFSAGSVGKEFTCNAENLGSNPGLGRSLGEGNGNLPQYSCLENPMDRGVWIVHRPQRARHNGGCMQTTHFVSVFCNDEGIHVPHDSAS